MTDIENLTQKFKDAFETIAGADFSAPNGTTNGLIAMATAIIGSIGTDLVIDSTYHLVVTESGQVIFV